VLRNIAFALVSIALGGCAHLSLKDKVVRDIHVRTPDTALCPGQEAKIVVTAALGDGTEAPTTGAGKGKVGWDNYEVTFAGDTAKDGKVRMPTDPRLTWKGPAVLMVVATDHPGVQWTGGIAVRYDCNLEANFGGLPGAGGRIGSFGREGADSGGRGNDGGDGTKGGDGHDGQNIEAWVTTVTGPESATLVQAAVQSEGKRSYYAFDPTRGTLTVDTSGGAGGVGGGGGNGGDGGKASGDVKRGRGGDGGNADCGGDGASGGDVLLHVDPRARPYLDRVLVHSQGGDSGGGGTGGSGGKGSPRGRDGRGGCGGEGGHGGHQQTVNETVEPLW
jgi:hypothetical protein